MKNTTLAFLLALIVAQPIAAQHAPAALPATSVEGITPADEVFFRVERTGHGRPMILIPGLLSTGEVWAGAVERFGGEYEMHVLTLAGFGGVPPTNADPFLAGARDAIIAYIRQHGLERPVLVGHSLGAFLSLWIAATAPDLVGPVVAVDGVPFVAALGDTTMTAERAGAQAHAVRTILAGMSSDALAAQTRLAFTTQVKDTAWHAVGERWAAASDAATVGRAVAEMLTTDIRPDMARVASPVLLFLAADGMNDDQREQALARYRAQLAAAPAARVVVARAARHFIMIDDAPFFYATLASFLSGHE